MAQELRDANFEALEAENPGPNFDAVRPTSSPTPPEPLRLTSPRTTTNAENTTPRARSLQWRTSIAMAAICAGGSHCLPSIVSDLSATASELAWVGASYLLGSAALQPFWLSFSKLVGRKWAVSVGFLLFACGSLIAALARKPDVLIAGRAVQGLGAGNISFLCQEIITTQRDKTPRIQAIHGTTQVFGVILGPVMGGLLTSYASWRWLFYIDVIIVGLALAVVVLCLDLPRFHRDRNRDGELEWPGFPGPIDWQGPFWILMAATGFLYGLQLGVTPLSWDSPVVMCLIFTGLLTSTIFAIHMVFHRNCIIPPWIFSDRSWVGCLAVGFLHGLTYIGCVYYLPLYLQLVLQASPVQSGLWTLIATVPMLSVTFVAGASVFLPRYRYRTAIISMSAATLTLGIGLSIALASYWNWLLLASVLLLIGAGIGPLLELPLYVLYHSTPASDSTQARAAFTFTQTLGSVIGLIIGQALLQDGLITRMAHAVEGNPDPVTLLADLDSLPLELQIVLRPILTASLRLVWQFFTITAGMCLLASFLIKHNAPARPSRQII